MTPEKTHDSLREEIFKRFEENHKDYFAKYSIDFIKCHHTKDSHYWNGGGRVENSGYDTCRIDNCGCVDYDEHNDFIEKVIGYKEKYDDIKLFISQSLTQVHDSAYSDGKAYLGNHKRIEYQRGYDVGIAKGLEMADEALSKIKTLNFPQVTSHDFVDTCDIWKAIQNLRSVIPEEEKKETCHPAWNDGFNACRSQALDALEKLREEKI